MMIWKYNQHPKRENNVLIAEFMGKKKEGLINALIHPEFYYIDESYLGYEVYWDKLMEVVEYIEKMDYGVKQCRKVVEIYQDSTKEVLIHIKEKSRFESLYKAIIEFIKLYNDNSRSNVERRVL